MTRRKKQSVREIPTSQVEEVLAKYSNANSRHKEITAHMEQQITQVREKFAADLEKEKQEMDTRFNELQLWAEINKNDFEKIRGKKMSHGVIGFRRGTPKTKPRKGFTWAAITQLLKQLLPDYVKTKEEANRERLIQDREQLEKQGMLEKVGVEIVQDETFFVEPKEEEKATA